jgi:hypothetical protein
MYYSDIHLFINLRHVSGSHVANFREVIIENTITNHKKEPKYSLKTSELPLFLTFF